jgi:hypothetical protein
MCRRILEMFLEGLRPGIWRNNSSKFHHFNFGQLKKLWFEESKWCDHSSIYYFQSALLCIQANVETGMETIL